MLPTLKRYTTKKCKVDFLVLFGDFFSKAAFSGNFGMHLGRTETVIWQHTQCHHLVNL